MRSAPYSHSNWYARNNRGNLESGVFYAVRADAIPGESKQTQKKLTRVEAGSNTSNVTLRVVGGDEKESLKSETVKYGQSPKGLGPEKDCAGVGQQRI
jgi:hypothetical protein